MSFQTSMLLLFPWNTQGEIWRTFALLFSKQFILTTDVKLKKWLKPSLSNHKIWPYGSWVILQVIWSHTIPAYEEQTSKKQLRMASGTSKPTAMHLKMACFTCTQTQIRFVSLYMWILDLNNNFSLFMNSYHMACNMACFHGVEKDERDMKLNHFWVNCSSKPQMFPFECLFLKMVKI